MSGEITITTGARLHFGLLVQGEPQQRTYGGVGLMIDQPGYSLTIRAAERDQILAAVDTTRRIEEFLAQLRASGSRGAWQVQVHAEIPAHAGLGSGTQLGLAIAVAAGRLSGEKVPPITELARQSGRSARSAIGTRGFEAGGLITQGELTKDGLIAPITKRVDFPPDWRFVLVTPKKHMGLSGETEKLAFRALAGMPEPLVRVLLDLQHEIVETAAACEFDDFGRRLFDFGEWVGKYFTPVQGGIYADVRMAELADRLRRDWVLGVGQTSWGPTLFAACESRDDARALMKRIQESEWGACEVRIVGAMNQGAKVEAY